MTQIREPIRVLFVEDSPEDFELALNSIKREGFSVTAVRVDAIEEMRAELKRGAWDVIILDYNLPKVMAPEVLQVLRDLESAVPVIIVSGTVGEDIAVESLKMGASDYVLKSNLKRLGASLRRELSAQRLRIERQNAITALIGSEKRLNSIVSLAMDAIIAVDGDQNIVLFNSAAEQMFGHRASDVMGTSLDRLIPVEYRSDHHKYVGKFAEVGKSNRGMGALGELYGLRANGEQFPIEASISRSEIGGRVMLTAIIRDLTERKKLESQLLESQKQEILGKMARGIAHDFNNVLLGILGYTELALQDAASNPKLKRKLELTLSGARRARELVRQILDFSRPTKGKPGAVEVGNLVKDVFDFIQSSTPKGVEFRFENRAKHPVVWGSASQLHQVVLNLCANAAQAIQKHQGTVNVFVREFEATAESIAALRNTSHVVGDPAPTTYVAVEVADTGVGIPREHMEKIFEPFYTTKPMGSGIGLEVVRRLVTSNHGFITVRSVLGEGTSIEVYLPLHQGAATTEAAAEQEATSGTVCNILVVDDEELLCELFDEVLRRFNCIPDIFTSAQKALDHARKNPGAYNLVMSDYSMPEMTGLEFLQQVREIGVTAPAILASGLGIPLSQENQERLKIVEILPKPFTIDELGDCLKRNMKRR